MLIKKIISIVLIILLSVTAFSGCSSNEITKTKDDSDKLTIITTLFPHYDFAKQIAGEYADITMLLPPGSESHTYEPTPKDIIKINNADVFIYTGAEMEPWAQKIISSSDNKDMIIIDTSKGIINLLEEDHDHDHDDEDITDDHDHIIDPHIWTSPVNAKIMVKNIADTLSELDAEHKDIYQTNATAYQNDLDKLDNDFREAVDNGNRKEIVFGGRFALYYFAKEYDLDYIAAYDSCGSEAEPNLKLIVNIINEINSKNIPVIFYQELVDPKIARTISQETGAQMLCFHSCHNVTNSEFNEGITYLDLMRQNLENLKEGLK